MNHEDKMQIETIMKIFFISIIIIIILFLMDSLNTLNSYMNVKKMVSNDTVIERRMGESDYYDILLEKGMDKWGVYAPGTGERQYDITAQRFLNSTMVSYVTVVLIPAIIMFFSSFKLAYNVWTNSDPFHKKNSVYIKLFGFFFLIAKFFSESIWRFVFNLAAFGEWQFKLMLNVDFLYLVVGLFIILIGYVFDYGYFLQEEYDQTI